MPTGPVGPVCSEFDFTWQTADCQTAHATIQSDVNPALFDAALLAINNNVLAALGWNPVSGVVTPIGPGQWTPARIAALAAALAPLYDAASYNAFITFLNPTQLGPGALPNTLTFVPGNISFGSTDIIPSVNQLLGLLTGTAAPGLNLTITLNRPRSSVTGKLVECARLATLQTTIVFNVTSGTGTAEDPIVQRGTYVFEVGSLAALCDCGARPVVISGTSAITFIPPPQ